MQRDAVKYNEGRNERKAIERIEYTNEGVQNKIYVAIQNWNNSFKRNNKAKRNLLK